MPRTKCCRDPDEELRELFFGTDNVSELSRRTGMTEPTLSRRKKNPPDLRISEAIAIIKAKKIPPEKTMSVLYEGINIYRRKKNVKSKSRRKRCRSGG